MEYISKSEKETSDFAQKIASVSKPGDIFALYGDLGSGKTTFTKALGKFLGIKEEITSPTFVILKEYAVPASPIKKMVHIDCYRFDAPKDAESIGFYEYICNKDVIILIEWPEKIEPILPARTKNIYFSYLDETTRKIVYK